MKIRDGFVSNSSSTSFAIIGFEADTETTIELLALDGVNPYDYEDDDYLYLPYGSVEGNNLSFYGSDDAFCIGWDAEELLQEFTIPEAKQHLKEFMEEKFNKKLSLNEITFHYGESSSGG
jgi:hypothetical protein